MIKQAIINLDGIKDKLKLYEILYEFIENDIYKNLKDSFLLYHDKIRIAFRDEGNYCRVKSNIIISFAQNEEDNGITLLYGKNDTDYIFSKTQYRYDGVPNTINIWPDSKNSYFINATKKLSIFGHIIDFVFEQLLALDYKCTKIAVFLDMCFDEEIKYDDAADGMDISQTVKRNYVLDEIKFKYDRRLPIDYKFSKTIIFNKDDPEYEVKFTMAMYCIGVYDYTGEYTLMIEYLDRTPDNNFNPEFNSTIIGAPNDFRQCLSSYMTMFKKVSKAFKPDTDKYESLILSRIY